MKKLALLVYPMAFVIAISTISCDRNDLPEASQDQSHSEMVFKAKAGEVTFNGIEMSFTNLETLYEYQTKINEDLPFRERIHGKYANKLAIGHKNNATFDRAFLFEKLTTDYLYAVNTDGNVLIGEQLIRFDKEFQYSVPLKNRNLLTVKNESEIDLTLVKRDTYGEEEVKTSLPNNRTQISLPGNGSSSHVYNFFVLSPDPYAGQSRRVTHRLYGHKGANVGGVTQHRMIMRFQMDYPGSGSNWYEVNEPRIIDYKVWFDFTFSQTGQTDYVVENRGVNNYQTTTNTEERVIGNHYSYSNAYGTWNATVTGYITTKLISPNGFDYSRTSGAPGSTPGPIIW